MTADRGVLAARHRYSESGSARAVNGFIISTRSTIIYSYSRDFLKVLFQHSEVIFWLSLYCVLSLRQLLENQMKYNINIQNLATC